MIDLHSCINNFTSGFQQKVNYNNGSSIISHRYRSWEYCREAFLKYKNGLPGNQNEKAQVVENLALHLAFYLASWGMYRGSSFLLRFDYKIHEPIVEWLFADEYKELFDLHLYQNDPKTYINLLFGEKGVVKRIEDYLKECRKIIASVKRDNISDTLITKILMGVYGCIPAYDKYFIKGLGKYVIQKKFSVKGVCDLLKQIHSYEDDINQTVIELNSNFKAVYTPMKVVDMYFWEKGH